LRTYISDLLWNVVEILERTTQRPERNCCLARYKVHFHRPYDPIQNFIIVKKFFRVISCARNFHMHFLTGRADTLINICISFLFSVFQKALLFIEDHKQILTLHRCLFNIGDSD